MIGGRRKATLLLDYLEDTLPDEQRRQVQASLEKSPALRRELDQLGQVLQALRSGNANWANVDLVPELRRQIASQSATAPMRPRAWSRPLMLGATLSLFLVGLLAWQILRPPSEGEFRARGSGTTPVADRWIAIKLYRLANNGPQPVGDTINKDDRLLISYSNLGPNPYRYLAIFGLSKDQVFWFYPAFERTGTDPQTITIEQGEDLELRELITHAFVPGALSIYAVFLRRPMRVSALERLASELRPGVGARLAVTDSGQHVLRLRVTDG